MEASSSTNHLEIQAYYLIFQKCIKLQESEETISASAPANSPPDTPHELNNDKDLKEANENGKLKVYF